MRKSGYFILLFIAVQLIACRQTPKEIIAPKKLESLLYDVHMSEGLMENDYNKFYRQSVKEEVMQEVLDKHGVTRAQFDTSLVWYGSHLELYIKVYDKVINRLRGENTVLKDRLAYELQQTLTRPGDSINIWKLSPYFFFTPKTTHQQIDFSVNSDEYFEMRDKFTLSMNNLLAVDTAQIEPHILLGLLLDNDSVIYRTALPDSLGHINLVINGDSLRATRKVFGTIAFYPKKQNAADYLIIYNDIILQRTRYKKSEALSDSINTHAAVIK